MKGGILVRWPELSGIGGKNVTNDLLRMNHESGKMTNLETQLIMKGTVVPLPLLWEEKSLRSAWQQSLVGHGACKPIKLALMYCLELTGLIIGLVC